MARRRAGLSQRELARKAGIPQSSISRIERSLISPTVDTLERLIRACGMELEPIDQPGENDVDRAQIRAFLRLSPQERLRHAVHAAREIERLRRSARWP
jgi:transcriptional regulator with XRE-family HTH domain